MMRLFKLAAISMFVLFIMATAVSLLIPEHIRISKAINLPNSSGQILQLISDTTKWKQWHPAYQHPGNIPLIHISQIAHTDTLVEMNLWQGKKKPVLNGWKIYHSLSDSLTLQWYMDFKLKWYPWQKFGSIFYENTYGTMMEAGLENIKKLSIGG